MVLAGSRQAGLRWVEFGRSGGADVGTLSPVLPSVLLDGGARGDRGAERVCVCVRMLQGCKNDKSSKNVQTRTGV